MLSRRLPTPWQFESGVFLQQLETVVTKGCYGEPGLEYEAKLQI
jgi:hypothetical protein